MINTARSFEEIQVLIAHARERFKIEKTKYPHQIVNSLIERGLEFLENYPIGIFFNGRQIILPKIGLFKKIENSEKSQKYKINCQPNYISIEENLSSKYNPDLFFNKLTKEGIEIVVSNQSDPRQISDVITLGSLELAEALQKRGFLVVRLNKNQDPNKVYDTITKLAVDYGITINGNGIIGTNQQRGKPFELQPKNSDDSEITKLSGVITLLTLLKNIITEIEFEIYHTGNSDSTDRPVINSYKGRFTNLDNKDGEPSHGYKVATSALQIN